LENASPGNGDWVRPLYARHDAAAKRRLKENEKNQRGDTIGLRDTSRR